MTGKGEPAFPITIKWFISFIFMYYVAHDYITFKIFTVLIFCHLNKYTGFWGFDTKLISLIVKCMWLLWILDLKKYVKGLITNTVPGTQLTHNTWQLLLVQGNGATFTFLNKFESSNSNCKMCVILRNRSLILTKEPHEINCIYMYYMLTQHL